MDDPESVVARFNDRWTATSSAPSVMRLTHTDRHGPSAGSYYVADFVADQGGSAQLTATPSIACFAPGPPCDPLTFLVVVR